MIRTLATVFTVCALSAPGFSQDKLVAFEAADVHVSPEHSIPGMTGGAVRGGRYTLQNATMLDLIRTAYDTEDDRISGGPKWLEADHFDIIAKAPAGTQRDKIGLMLRSLLAERFRLTLHTGTKSMQAYVLTVGKNGSKLRRSSDTERGGCNGQQETAPGGTIYLVVACHGLSGVDIAQDLHQIAAGYVGDHPLVDSTKLDGLWDFDLKFSGRNQIATAGGDAITFADALDKQLGLKLDLQNAAVPVLIIDNVNEKPTANVPGIEAMFPAMPTEFEVADVKPSAPEVKGESGGFQPGGRIDLRGFTLRTLMGFAWALPQNLLNDVITGGPSWMDSTRFDIVAKAPSAGPTTGNELPTDEETLVLMLRNLLIDRFQLKTHTENHETTVYAMAPKGEPKLRKPDPGDRASCKRGPGPPNPNGTSTIQETCVNTTMADLAKNLSQWAPAYFEHPVLDATGLSGGWNFTLTWTGRGQLLGTLAPNSAAGSGAAADPGGLSAFEAVEKQLGFKLNVQKRSFPVTVIDHVEQPHP